jgi:hypothetical protein
MAVRSFAGMEVVMVSPDPSLVRRTESVAIDRPGGRPEPRMAPCRPCAMSNQLAFRFLTVFALALALATVAGCGGAASGTGSPAPAPTSTRVVTSSDALARVVAREPRLTGIQPFDSGLVGQASWYTVQPASGVGAFIVTTRVGWGDCESGCINEHSWVVAVGPDGVVTVVSESGPAVPPDAWPSPAGAGSAGVAGVALAGPVCPVERVPPDPACAARPVPGATVVIRDSSGSEVARTVTAADGSFFVELPAGEYTVEPQPAAGLMGTASSQGVTVADGAVATVQLDYDTGIR